MLKDYVKSSKYFSDDDIKTDINSVEKSKKTVYGCKNFLRKLYLLYFLSM